MLGSETAQGNRGAFALFASGLVLATSFGFCILAGAAIYAVRAIDLWGWGEQYFLPGLIAALILAIPVAAGGLIARAGMRRHGHTMTALRLAILIALVCLSTIGLFVGAWIALYPPGDPKNMRYTLWKEGLYSISPAEALSSAMEDPERGKVLLGKTKDELRAEFGYLIPSAQASPYLKFCLANSQWQRADVAFLRNSDLVIVFKNGKSIEYARAKGC